MEFHPAEDNLDDLFIKLQSLRATTPANLSPCHVSLLIEALATQLISDTVPRSSDYYTQAYELLEYFWDWCATDDNDDEVELFESVMKLLTVIAARRNRFVCSEATAVILERALSLQSPVSHQMLGLKTIRYMCRKNEEIREYLVNQRNIFSLLMPLFDREAPCADYVCEWCGAVIALIASDDKTVSYNRSLERMNIFRHEGAPILLLCKCLEHYNDNSTANSIMVLLGAMAGCKGNFSEEMVQKGVLAGIAKIIRTATSSGLLVKKTLSVLRMLCMSSADIRTQVAESRLVRNILRTTVRPFMARIAELDRPDVLEVALDCLVYVTLRNQLSIAQLLESKGVEVVLEILQENMEEIPLLKSACVLLRNIAVHGSQLGKEEILKSGAEAIIQEVGLTHRKLRRFYVLPLVHALELGRKFPRGKTNKIDLLTPAIMKEINEDFPYELHFNGGDDLCSSVQNEKIGEF